MSHYSTKKSIDVLLKIIAGGGAITLSLLAPNAVELFTKAAEPFLEKDFDKAELEKLLKYMEKSKLVELKVQRNGTMSASMTDKAHRRLEKSEINEIEINEPKYWDKKWRIIMYDIPHENKENRFYLLEQLHRLGFFMVQRSIWVYPYPCTDEILEIAKRLELGKFITFIVGDIESSIEGKLLKRFQLQTKV